MYESLIYGLEVFFYELNVWWIEWFIFKRYVIEMYDDLIYIYGVK